ncbi:HEAT repeat domain-containing protein [Streptomyces sp. NPDC002812]|uniref:HEAT repeat domain-containing protein n=1 Tax=Streptomyces sp. NPDC002812 TaxID=3154434 RepID=UPI00331B6300
MSTSKWLVTALWRYVVTAAVGAGALALALAATEGFADGVFSLGLRVVLLAVPLLTVGTMLATVPLAGRRYEPPSGGPMRIRGGWMVLLVLVPALPLLLIAPHLFLILLVTQLVYATFVLPCGDSRDTADALRALADPELPAEHRARIARAVGSLSSRPVVESLMGAAADKDPEVSEAALESLYGIWRRDGVVGEDLVLRLPEQGREQVRALGVKVRSPW